MHTCSQALDYMDDVIIPRPDLISYLGAVDIELSVFQSNRWKFNIAEYKFAQKNEILEGVLCPKKVGILSQMFFSTLSHLPKPIICGEWGGLK